MSDIIFPPNPENGMIFEAKSGMYFQYIGPTKSWKRLDGFDNIQIATDVNDGLMSKDDYKKIQELIIPPPTLSLTSEQCNTIFREGLVELDSTENDLEIKSKLPLHTSSEISDKLFEIHENTIGIDFSVNLNRLIQRLNENNQIKYRAAKGPIGNKGIRGDDGIDLLDTGPQGEKGDDGTNASYPGILEQDFNDIDSVKTSKAVVDIKYDNEDPTKLIVVIGNIGNPIACPKRIKWTNGNSPWLLAMSDTNEPCNFENVKDICVRTICTSDLYYIDTTDIQQQIKERYEELIIKAKNDKEQLVLNMMKKLIEIFNAQKQALCCSIESILTKEKNQQIRDAWSASRYAAAQGMYAFNITDKAGFSAPRADPQFVPSDFYPIQSKLPSQKVKISDVSNPLLFDCKSCYAEITLDTTNSGINRSVSVSMPPGSYVATIIQCCPAYQNGASGIFNIEYVDEDSNGKQYRKSIRSVDQGKYSTKSQAESIYVGDSTSFRHHGGTVKYYLDLNTTFAIGGQMILCVQPVSCFGECGKETYGSFTGVTDITLTDPTCAMKASHVEFYERGWRIGECCGAYINIMGNKFIVVYRSIGIDTSCGGGEYLETPCISHFMSHLGKQIAVAWPTVDGDNFFGLPRDDGTLEIPMVYEESLSAMIVNKIQSGDVFKKIGIPEEVITHVIVPAIT